MGRHPNFQEQPGDSRLHALVLANVHPSVPLHNGDFLLQQIPRLKNLEDLRRVVGAYPIPKLGRVQSELRSDESAEIRASEQTAPPNSYIKDSHQHFAFHERVGLM